MGIKIRHMMMKDLGSCTIMMPMSHGDSDDAGVRYRSHKVVATPSDRQKATACKFIHKANRVYFNQLCTQCHTTSGEVSLLPLLVMTCIAPDSVGIHHDSTSFMVTATG